MSQISVKLYRLLHRVRRDFLKAQIPLVGIVGFDAPPTLYPGSQLAIAFRNAAVPDAAAAARHGSDGFRALRQAQQQLQVLRSTEEETREALRCWFQLCQSWAHQLQQRSSPGACPRDAPYGNRTATRCSTSGSDGDGDGDGDGGTSGHRAAELPGRLLQLAAALEDGALLVERLYDANHLSLENFDDGADESEPAAEAAEAEAVPGGGGGGDEPGLPAPLLVPSVAAARRQLDELATVVAEAHPGLFPGWAAAGRGGDGGSGSGGGGGSGDGGGLLRRQLEAISEELFYRRKFKHEPIEWVYDGLAPALLPQVLVRRRGIPLSLAVLYCSVCRRLGVAAVPVKATAGGGPGVSEGPAALHRLPPEVAARQAGRTVALAPPLDAWLIAAQAAAAGTGTMTSSAVAAGGVSEPAGPPGARSTWLLVDVDQRGRVMELAEARRRFADLRATPLPRLLPFFPPELWAELGRLMVTAHGRRGESDLVAHWLVQVLALDHRSAEWLVMASK